MTSRRTRSGALLGCTSEPRRARQASLKKQAVRSSEEQEKSPSPNLQVDSDVSETLDTSVETATARGGHDNALSRSAKKLTAGANIWERLEKDADGLACDATASAENLINRGKAAEATEATLSPGDHAGSRKGRKQEILVSLLESEASTPVTQVKSTTVKAPLKSSEQSHRVSENKVGVQVTSSDVNLQSTAIECFSSLHNKKLRIFTNTDYHRGDTVADFSHMPEVSGEPFFVSLSKDKNKELNMVKTSSGMVRVGAGISNLVPHSHTCSDSQTKFPVYSTPTKAKTVTSSAREDKEREGSSGLQASTQSKMHSSKKGKDKSTGRKDAKEEEKSWDHKTAAVNKPQCGDVDIKGWHKGLGNESSESSYVQCQERHSDKAYSTGRQQSLTQAETVKKSVLQMTHVSGLDFNKVTRDSPVKEKSAAPWDTSRYPLMKEILTEQSTLPSDIHSDVTHTQQTKTVSLLKGSATALSRLPTKMDVDSELKTKTVVKRSERIRSKNGTGKPKSGTMSTQLSVISTMKSTVKNSDKKCKKKPRAQMSKKRTKACPPRDNDRKKSGHTDITTTRVMSKSKEMSKCKGSGTMSREVMDAIVQSIEETVSQGGNREDCVEMAVSGSRDACLQSGSRDYNSTPQASNRCPGRTTYYSSLDHWATTSVAAHGQNGKMNSCTSGHGRDDNYGSKANNNKHNKGTSHSRSRSSSSSSNHHHHHHHHHTSKLSSSKKSGSKERHGKNNAPVRKAQSAKEKSASSKTSVTSSHSETATPVGKTEGEIKITDTKEGQSSTSTEQANAGTVTAVTGKRCRKKTKKAEEALDDSDVFCDDDLPVHRPRAKKRSQTDSGSSSQRRIRRCSQLVGRVRDPVLEEHAFILWASENRSQLEQRHPGATLGEMDAILSARWSDVTDGVKARFFSRAREAFSDEDRHASRSSTPTGLESKICGDFFLEHDPVFTQFSSLPVKRQRDFLRNWLKLFQRMLPKKDYIDFIVTFKRACGRESADPSGRPIRTRMSCLEPRHYKTLFDMIRLSKARVLDMYKEKKNKEKKFLWDTYSRMLHKLIRGEGWPQTMVHCQSQALTQILHDLGLPDSWDGYTSNGITTGSVSIDRSLVPMCREGDERNAEKDRGAECVGREAMDEGGNVTDKFVDIQRDSQLGQMLYTDDLSSNSNVSMEVRLTESDYSVLSTDLALSLLSDLSEVDELPVLSQQVIDQVFLAPPQYSMGAAHPRRGGTPCNRRSDMMLPCLPPTVCSSAVGSSECQWRHLPTDVAPCPKMNIHHPPASLAAGLGLQHQHQPMSGACASLVPHRQAQKGCRELASPHAGVCHRQESPIDMHSYSITMENLLQCPAYLHTPQAKCIKVHPKTVSAQARLAAPVGQCPVSQPTKLYPRLVPVAPDLQHNLPSHLFPQPNPTLTLLDKSGSHHVYHMASQLATTSSSSPSRLYPLSSLSPLITSLSPLHTSRYTRGTKLYSQHCQMVPYKPRLQLATSSSGHRRPAQALPISTTFKAGGARAQNNLHQIKVCLPTQALKIPIAKLRGSRKASYVKGKLKNMNLSSAALEPFNSFHHSQACQYSMRNSNTTNVLAKIFNIQTKGEHDASGLRSMEEEASTNMSSDTQGLAESFKPNLLPQSVNMQLGALDQRANPNLNVNPHPNTHGQFMCATTNAHQCLASKTNLPTHTAVVVSPLSWGKSSHLATSTLQSTCKQRTVQSGMAIDGALEPILDADCSGEQAGSGAMVTDALINSMDRCSSDALSNIEMQDRNATDVDHLTTFPCQWPPLDAVGGDSGEFIVVGTCTFDHEHGVTPGLVSHAGSHQMDHVCMTLGDSSCVCAEARAMTKCDDHSVAHTCQADSFSSDGCEAGPACKSPVCESRPGPGSSSSPSIIPSPHNCCVSQDWSMTVPSGEMSVVMASVAGSSPQERPYCTREREVNHSQNLSCLSTPTTASGLTDVTATSTCYPSVSMGENCSDQVQSADSVELVTSHMTSDWSASADTCPSHVSGLEILAETASSAHLLLTSESAGPVADNSQLLDEHDCF